MKFNHFLLINTIVPIVIGAIIYYLIDPSVIFVRWIDLLLGNSYHFNITSNYFIWKAIRNYLFDYIWSYSLVFAICYVKSQFSFFQVMTVSIGLGLVFELLQSLECFPGTFDYMDIIVQVVSVFSALIYIMAKRRNYCEEEV